MCPSYCQAKSATEAPAVSRVGKKMRLRERMKTREVSVPKDGKLSETAANLSQIPLLRAFECIFIETVCV